VGMRRNRYADMQDKIVQLTNENTRLKATMANLCVRMKSQLENVAHDRKIGFMSLRWALYLRWYYGNPSDLDYEWGQFIDKVGNNAPRVNSDRPSDLVRDIYD
jgi:putative methionine-R-sulfoxide reductase with GAF domain